MDSMESVSRQTCVVDGDADLAEQVLALLRRVHDPEVGINIVDLGLIYGIQATPEQLQVVMTLTSPGCPVGDQLTTEVRQLLLTLAQPGCDVQVHLVWEPAWQPERMSEAARRDLGWN